MGWNGSGVVVRQTPVASGVTAWADTKAAGDVNITTADHDYQDQDLANAITNTIAKDGQNFPTADLPMNGQKHTGVADAVSNDQYATLRQLIGASPVVGNAINAQITVPTASATATYTADQVITGIALGGQVHRTGQFNHSVNLSTTGVGGMDTGLAPVSGYVAVYVIYNPTSGVSALLATDATSAIAPMIYGGANMPAGYTFSGLVSVWRTNASRQFVPGAQLGRKIALDATVIISSSAQKAIPTALSLAAGIPFNALSVDLVITIGSSVSSTCAANIFPLNSGTASYAAVGGTGLAFFGTVTDQMIPSNNRQVFYGATTGAGTMAFSVNSCAYRI